jgi:spore coat polysaccharide biosynthesis predicted glycosyltransferase SpsG
MAQYLNNGAKKYEILMGVEGDIAVERFLSEKKVSFSITSIDAIAEKEQDSLNEFLPDIIIVDMLEPSDKLLSRYKKYCNKLVLFNDLGRDYSIGDVIISPQLLQAYPKKINEQRHLNGPDYFILSDNIINLKKRAGINQAYQDVSTLLVVMGGCINKRVFERVIKVIHKVIEINIKVNFIIGYDSDIDLYSYDYLKERGVTFVEGTENIGEFMAEADLALASSGYVKYELAALGTPALLVSVVDHQDMLGSVFAQKSGAAEYIGNILNIELKELVDAVKRLIFNESKRREMSEAGLRLMDGDALRRIESEIAPI